mgnify:CR=1 FL=1|tara:strand:- start:356 stop:700 length:345 start_codon:yes stop_codon:yes gene_type:complete
MTLTALFMTLCAVTSLDCEKVNVEYVEFSDARLGAATLYTSGNSAIFISKTLEGGRNAPIKKIMIHELSHLVTYRNALARGDNPIGKHNTEYKKVCRTLAKINGLSTKLCKSHE